MDNIIGPFRNEYSFLSNMYSCQVTIEGMGTFTCAEAAFQACKCTNQEDMKSFFGISGREAKKLGRKINCRTDWDNVRVDMMRKVVQAKFTMPELADKLIATGGEELVEINTWNDKFWGAVYENGMLVGENNLGKILMKVRAELQNKEETKTMENTIKITTNTAIRDNGNTFAVARIAGFQTIKNLVWDEKDAIAVGVKIADYNGKYTQETMMALQEGYLAHLRKCVGTLRSMVGWSLTLVVKPFQVGPLTKALSSLGAKVELDTQPQSTNELPMIGCGRVKGKFKNKGVSEPAKGGRASAILLPYEGYNFDPKNDPCWEVHGVVFVGNEAKLGFFIFVAAKTKDAARNMIRSWIDREVGKDAKVYTDKESCKNFGIYGCFQPVRSESRYHLNMAFECEHLDGPQFIFTKETIDISSCADIMALLQSQKTEITALKAENSELRTIVDELRIAVAQLQVKIYNKSNDDGDNDNDGDDNDGNNNGGGNNTIDPSDFEDFSYATLEDEPQPESTQETSQVSTPEQEESEPEQPELTPEPEQPEVATAITEETIEAVGKFLSFANEEIQEDGLFKVTDEEKQKAELAKKAKVQRALKALAILGVSAKEFTKLVKKAKGQRVIKVLKFYDIKVENDAVFINQGMFIEDWSKLDIGENGSLVVSC